MFYSYLQLHIDSVAEAPSSPDKKDSDADFFKDHTTDLRLGYGDSSSGTPPRVGSPARLADTPPRVSSNTKLSSLSQENRSSSGSLTVDAGIIYVLPIVVSGQATVSVYCDLSFCTRALIIKTTTYSRGKLLNRFIRLFYAVSFTLEGLDFCVLK